MQNSAGDSATNKSLPSSPQHLPIDKPQSIDAISSSPIQSTSSATIQGGISDGEGGRGGGQSSENIVIPSQVLELNSGEGGDDGENVSLVAVAMSDAVEKPMVEVGHKRKPSKGIDVPNWKSISNHSRVLHPNRNSQHVNSPPISPPTGQQLNDQLVPQEEGEEGNEKAKGNEGSATRGLRGLDLNQQMEGVENSSDHDEQETEVDPFVAHEVKVKPSVAQEIEVEPYAAENNAVKPSAIEKNEVEPSAAENSGAKPSAIEKNEVEAYAAENNEIKPSAIEKNGVEPSAAENNELKPSAIEKNGVEPSAAENNEVEPSAIEKNEVEPSAVDKIEVEPYPTEKHEVKPSTTKEKEVESSLTEKNDDFRNAKVFEFDLNELPPDEDEN